MRRTLIRLCYGTWLFVVLQQPRRCQAALPNAELWIPTAQSDGAPLFSSPLLVTYGLFGAAGSSVAGPLITPPNGDELLCNEANGLVDYQPNNVSSSRSNSQNKNTTARHPGTVRPNFTIPLYLHQEILLVPRGNCSFEDKALSAQRLGASGILIYNTLQSRYGWNDTTQRVIYPETQDDYECANGRDSNISALSLQLDPPSYNATFHNPLLTLSSPTNLCQLAPSSSSCASQRCLVTGPATDGDNNDTGVFTTCCAWDISETMGADDTSSTNESVHIVATFLTMRQGDTLLSNLSLINGTMITIQPRPFPKWNASLFFLLLLGTFAVSLAAWNSAHEYRYTMLQLRLLRQRRQRQQGQESQQPTQEPLELEEDEGQEERVATRREETKASTLQPDLDLTAACPNSAVSPLCNVEQAPSRTGEPPDQLDSAPEEPSRDSALSSRLSSFAGMFQGSPLETMEIQIWHVVVFLVIASTILFLLFFYKFYSFVVVFYAFGCAGAVSLIVIRPLLEQSEHLLLRVARNRSVDDDNQDTDNRNKEPTCLHELVLGERLGLTWLDILSGVGGYSWSGLWLYLYFTHVDPSPIAFYWISQNIFGLSLCILILSLIKLNSLRIGTALLIAVFFYDIFFVFVTPYLFNGESIMVSVATSGGSPEGTADFCEKYPSDHTCRGGNPLPFLFTIPHINDYRGGSSLLGLGDVVLPGVLLSFAARLDEARRLLNRHTTLRLPEAPERWYQGYFPPLIVAYLVGLLMANCAVVWMQRGQPALLYLVPSCLGTLLVLGRHELKDLWKGPKHLRWADRLIRYVLRRV
jgi:signal peptide peptidase-like protein 2B